jgi:DNA recombination protein RmuC
MDTLTLIIVAAAAFIGVASGWLLGSRPAAALRKERDKAIDDHRRVLAELAVFEERARQLEPLQAQLRAAVGERDAALQDAAALRPVAGRVPSMEQELRDLRAERQALAEAKAGFERGEEERRRAYEEQLANIKDLEAKVEARFGDLAGKALEGAHDSFLKRAEERFKHSEEIASKGLKALLQPVNERLQRYEEGVAKVEAERRDSFGNLVGLIESMRVGQEKVSSEAAKLVNSLRNAPKSRGRWGEQQLKNVLETCGLTENCDFQT